MTLSSRAFALTGILVAALGLTACNQASQEAPTAEATPPADYIARVNDQYITQKDVDDFIHARQGNQPGASIDPELAVQELVNMAVLEQKAEAEGIDKRPDVEAQLDRQRTNLLVSTLVREYMETAEFSDEELKAEYDAQVAQLGSSEYKARHILVDTEEAAKDLITQLEGGADFAELAKEHSTGPSAERGGDLGWFSPGTMVPEFSAAVVKMKKGEFTHEPVKTQFGWHVILLEDERSNEPPAFEDVKQQLRGIVANKSLQDYVAKLREGADVETKPIE